MWALEVKGRLEYFQNDLHAADCVYHHSCSTNFRIGKGIPYQYRREDDLHKKLKAGRPENELVREAFLRVCSYLEENEDEQITVSDLTSKMESFLEGSSNNAYSQRYMKQKLMQHFGDSIFICEQQGKHDIVVLRESVHFILRNHYGRKSSADENIEKMRIIETAARLIKSDIKTKVSNKECYPSAQDINTQQCLEYLPPTLKLLCSKLFTANDTEMKIASIGQCIMQACRPRAITAPLQLSLAVQMHSHFRSRYLIGTLNPLSFCSSYSEVTMFERNAAVVTCGNLIELNGTEALLFAADNVDHNVRTLTGENTFHGMGIIASVTPSKTMPRIIPRSTISNEVIKDMAKVKIHEYVNLQKLVTNLKFEVLHSYDITDGNTDLIWLMAWHFKTTTPNWSGTMKMIHHSSDVEKSSLTILPILDLQATNMTCILSTLKYICGICQTQQVTAVVTFDQPLFWKARIIVDDCRYKVELEDLVILLGSFHTLMNLLGAIGTLMEGSGLRDVLQVVYGENAVSHMISGKAVSRAFRGHMLVDSSLTSLILENVLGKEGDLNEDYSGLVQKILDLHEDLVKKSKSAHDKERYEPVLQLKKLIKDKMDDLKQTSLTSKMWIQYQSMVSLLRKLVQADRTGSWNLHLQAVNECLPIFAAAGHTNYLKSGYLYLQDMQQLPQKKPHVYASFQKGLHVIHRTDTSWSGLGSDLVIEQVLMRTLKTTGGLTRGSGLTDIQRALWVLSMSACCEFNSAMQVFTDVSYSTSDQHKEMHKSRLLRDRADGGKIVEFLKQCSPFSSDSSLRNIVTGVTFDVDNVNVHDAVKIGSGIVAKLPGNYVFSYTCKRSDKVKTLASIARVKIDDTDDSSIDPLLLFQRLIVVASNGHVNLKDALQYELCAYPPSLFESPTILRKGEKSKLAHCINKHIANITDGQQSHQMSSTPIEAPQGTTKYVFDGGSLLHRMPWKTGVTYSCIASSYADITVKRYGSVTVVFDGYSVNTPSIKDCAHRRRGMNSTQSPIVNFSPHTPFIGKKEQFLQNAVNKTKIIHLIGDHLSSKGCHIIYANGDADVDIVREAVASSKCMNTVVLGEDTDLLILLLYHSLDTGFSLHFRSDIQISKAFSTVYDIHAIRKILGADMCKHLLFLHAFTGCDSTSHIHGIGKTTAFKKLLTSNDLKQLAEIFCSENKSKNEIEEAGKKSMVLLYGGKKNEALDVLRHRIFKEKIASSNCFVQPERLPSTASAVKYHSFRCYYQILEWIGKQELVDACSWGWFVRNNEYFPKLSDLPPAPRDLLTIIRCKCTKECGTMRCSCRKNGLLCTDACGQCQESSCVNYLHNQYEVHSEHSDIDE